MKSATFFCGGKLVPASRFRVKPIADQMLEKGWDVAVRYGYGNLDQKISNPIVRASYRLSMRGVRSVRTAFEFRHGPVLIQRLAWPLSSIPERILNHRGRAIVFDFDDAIFLDDKPTLAFMRSRAFDSMCRAAAHVVAGNSWLASMIPGDAPVSIIPTGIDTTRYYPLVSRLPIKRVTIGWIGTSSNFRYLFSIESEILKLRTLGIEFDLLICSDVDPVEFRGRTGAKFIRWSPEVEVPFLQSLSIGIMPLGDDDWCKGKCSFKIIQYMAVGCPVVASNVGFNRDVVMHERTGLLVDREWIDALAFLVGSEEVRSIYGKRARTVVESRFGIDRISLAYEGILSELQ